MEERSIEEGIRQVEFLLSSVLRERSRNLRSRASEGPPRPPLLSDIERQIRQLEQGQRTLDQVLQALRALAATTAPDHRESPLIQFQARVEVKHRASRDQRKAAGCVKTGE